MGNTKGNSPLVGIVMMGRLMAGEAAYLKRHTETLVKDVGLEAACELTGKSKATLGRYYSGGGNAHWGLLAAPVHVDDPG